MDSTQMKLEIDYCYALNDYLNKDELIQYYVDCVTDINFTIDDITSAKIKDLKKLKKEIVSLGAGSEFLLLIANYYLLNGNFSQGNSLLKAVELLIVAASTTLPIVMTCVSYIEAKNKINQVIKDETKEQILYKDGFNQKINDLALDLSNDDNLWQHAVKLKRVHPDIVL